MVSKSKTVYECQTCASQFPKWLGRCSECGAWGTLVESVIDPQYSLDNPATAGANSHNLDSLLGNEKSVVSNLQEIDLISATPVPTMVDEFDHVLGGGLVAGSVTLIGGEPGIGKSTLVMQILGAFADRNISSLYASAEESSSQIRSRASRLGITSKEIGVVATAKVEEIIAHANNAKTSVLVVDSIHTVMCAEISSSAGTVSQVRECAHRLTEFAKRTGTTVILVGQVTKEGTLAGPRVLEHVVDTVLSFEGDDHALVRTLRVSKHRFGNTDELGLFDMTPSGLVALDSDSALMANVGDKRPSGLVVGAAVDGSRPFLIEVQALVDSTTNPNPPRIVQGFEQARLNSLLAVLSKRCGINLSFHDVYVSLSGGIRIKDPGLDLAICVAIASALKEIPVSRDLVFAGEIGLSGEVRSSPHSSRRIREADRRGHTNFFINSGKTDIKSLGLDKLQVKNSTMLKSVIDAVGI